MQQLAAPNRQGVLFHPAIGWVVNWQRNLSRGQGLAASIEDHGAGAAGALIKGQQKRISHARDHHASVLTRLRRALRHQQREID